MFKVHKGGHKKCLGMQNWMQQQLQCLITSEHQQPLYNDYHHWPLFTISTDDYRQLPLTTSSFYRVTICVIAKVWEFAVWMSPWSLNRDCVLFPAKQAQSSHWPSASIKELSDEHTVNTGLLTGKVSHILVVSNTNLTFSKLRTEEYLIILGWKLHEILLTESWVNSGDSTQLSSPEKTAQPQL